MSLKVYTSQQTGFYICIYLLVQLYMINNNATILKKEAFLEAKFIQRRDCILSQNTVKAQRGKIKVVHTVINLADLLPLLIKTSLLINFYIRTSKFT